MNCKKIIKILPDYIDNNLSNEQNSLINEHLANCSKCSTAYHNLINTISLLKSKNEIPEQAFYYTRLKQRMENDLVKKENAFFSLFKQKILQPVFYLASVIIAVYIGILIGSNTPNSEKLSYNDNSDKDYIELFSESQYFNDLEIETIENNYLTNDTITE